MSKLLIIEDSMTQANTIAAHLASYEIDVMIANDGPQGLRLAAFMMPDLIILDVNLPSMNGCQVCRRLKRDPKTADIPVIMLTAATSPEQTTMGLEAGADDYIHKGQDAPEQVIKAIRLRGLATRLKG